MCISKILIVFVTVSFVAFCPWVVYCGDRSSQVNIIKRLWARYSRNSGLFLGRGEINLPLRSMMTAQYLTYNFTRSLSLAEKRLAHESDYWHQIVPKLRMIWVGGGWGEVEVYLHCPRYIHGVRRDKFSFHLWLFRVSFFIFFFMCYSRLLVSIRGYVKFPEYTKTYCWYSHYISSILGELKCACARGITDANIRPSLSWETETLWNWRLCYWLRLTIWRSCRWRIELTLWPLKTSIVVVPHREPLNIAFYIFIQQIQLLNILTMVYIDRFFSSKCSLFHNSNLFGSCFIHISYTVCAKI